MLQGIDLASQHKFVISHHLQLEYEYDGCNLWGFISISAVLICNDSILNIPIGILFMSSHIDTVKVH